MVIGGSWCYLCSCCFLLVRGVHGCYQYFFLVLYDSLNILEGFLWFLKVLGGVLCCS